MQSGDRSPGKQAAQDDRDVEADTIPPVIIPANRDLRLVILWSSIEKEEFRSRKCIKSSRMRLVNPILGAIVIIFRWIFSQDIDA